MLKAITFIFMIYLKRYASRLNLFELLHTGYMRRNSNLRYCYAITRFVIHIWLILVLCHTFEYHDTHRNDLLWTFVNHRIIVKMAMATSDIKYKVVVGIDFGTTYSGYAYSFADSKETIHINRNWSDRFGYQVRLTCCILNLIKTNVLF